MQLLRRLVPLILFVVAFAATRGLIVAAAEAPLDDNLQKKLDRLEAYPPELLFIGSSRVARGLDPGTASEALATAGLAVSAFNMGTAGLGGLELVGLLDEILEAAPGVKWVVVEPSDLVLEQRGGAASSLRNVRWHTPSNTARTLQAIVSSDEPIRDRVEWAYRHLDSLLYNLTLVGRAMSVIDPPDPSTGVDFVLGKGRDGYVSLDAQFERDQQKPRETGVETRRRQFLEDPTVLEERLDHLALEAGRSPTLLELELARSIDSIVRAHGAIPIFIRMPGSLDGAWLSSDGDMAGFEVLDYSYPADLPDLFGIEMWFDVNHLNERGASLFTQRVASDLADVIAGVP